MSEWALQVGRQGFQIIPVLGSRSFLFLVQDHSCSWCSVSTLPGHRETSALLTFHHRWDSAVPFCGSVPGFFSRHFRYKRGPPGKTLGRWWCTHGIPLSTGEPRDFEDSLGYMRDPVSKNATDKTKTKAKTKTRNRQTKRKRNC